MATCEDGVAVCRDGGVLSAGSAKRSFLNRFRLRLCSCGLYLDGNGLKGSGGRVLSLSGGGCCGSACWVLVVMVACFSADR